MAADNELENLKTDCITALRKGDEDAFDAAALKFQESSAGDLQFKMETLGLLACLALKQNYCRSALKALNLLSVCSLDIAPEDAQTENVFLQNLRYAAVMAARTHNKDIFAAAVSKLAVRYAKNNYIKENTGAFISVLNVLMFIAADRRYRHFADAALAEPAFVQKRKCYGRTAASVSARVGMPCGAGSKARLA